MSRHYAVFGHPVAHSLSPRIHAAFGRQTGIALEYVAIDAAPAEFATALDAFAAGGGIGANVTLPLKEAAFALCLQRYGHGLRIASLFWGLWLLPFGWLVLRSGRLPRVLGLLLVLGGVGYVVQVFGGLVPGVSDSAWIGYVRLPAALGEICSCLWLLVFGARDGVPESSASEGRR